MSKEIQPIELKNFIQQTIQDVESGAEIGFRKVSSIEFEISVSKTEQIGGGLKIYIFQGNAHSDKEDVAKLKFSVTPRDPTLDEKIKNSFRLYKK